tara:strand:+ start:3407 stop:3988 length:582 start_codon:yes stop_codon:yes gene_type:complete
MSHDTIIAIQSPTGEISIGSSQLDKNNPYISNKLNNINDEIGEDNEHIVIYLDENELRHAYSLQSQAFFIKLFCILNFTLNGVKTLSSNIIDYNSIMDLIFSGYGYSSVSKFNRAGVGIFSFYELYKLLFVIFDYFYSCYFFSNTIYLVPGYYSLFLLCGFLQTMAQLYITYYIQKFYYNMPNLDFNDEISSI